MSFCYGITQYLSINVFAASILELFKIVKMEVEAHLKSRGVYLSGERLQCDLIFSNVGRMKHKRIETEDR